MNACTSVWIEIGIAALVPANLAKYHYDFIYIYL